MHEETARSIDDYTANYIRIDEYTPWDWDLMFPIGDGFAEQTAPEQELETGDSSMLDAFLDEFLAPGS